MIRKYALFSQNNPKKHIILVALMLLSVIASMLLLLSEEKFIFTLGLIIPIGPLVIFAKASDYRQKYLHD